MEETYIADSVSDLEALPEDLNPYREAIAACLRDRKRWRLEPQSTEHATWVPSLTFVKGQFAWAKTAYLSGYEVAPDGIPSKVLWSYDEGWERSDEMELSDPEFAAWDQEEHGEGLQRRATEGWRTYSLWVADHGEDPLGAFVVPQRHDTSWEVEVAWLGEQGLTLLSARHSGSAEQLPAEQLPVEVHQAITLDAELFPTWESFYRDHLKLDIQPPDAPTHTSTIVVSIPNPNHRQELVEAARQRATGA